jgi:hypothetical protein
MGSGDWVVVYRGFEPAGLDLVESMLRVEGLEPRRLGQTSSPALLGVGEALVQQLVEVPREHVQAARALIAASNTLSPDAAVAEDLEAQALGDSIEQPAHDDAPDARSRAGIRFPALLLAAGFLIYLWLRLR